MSIFLIVAIVVVFVLLAAMALFASMRRRDTEAATGALSRETRKRDQSETPLLVGAPASAREVEKSAALERRPPEIERAAGSDLAAYVPPDPDQLGVTRRQFLNRGIITFFAISLAGFGASVLAFLWPIPQGGFGSVIQVGKITDILSEITAGSGFFYFAPGRLWMTAYPLADIQKAEKVYSAAVLPSLEAGVTVVYQTCPHLGCRVPSCLTSQWFECPCHGSQYSQAGEKRGGPAPRGMDRFTNTVTGGVLTVDTGSIIQGPPIGTDTTGQQAEGPHCVG
jgi:cytochrome b6-f complex iron-sulfur subunit